MHVAAAASTADDVAALCARSTENPDVSTGSLAHPFARLLVPLTRLLAPHYSLYSRAPLYLLIRSLVHFARYLAHGKVIDGMAILSVFFSVLAYSVLMILLRLLR